jgi:hypothetical protein
MVLLIARLGLRAPERRYYTLKQDGKEMVDSYW